MSNVATTYRHLPVSKVLPELSSRLTGGHVVLTGPTGSGKTTLVPAALLDHPPAGAGTILVLEPRRVAARAAARRISTILQSPVGDLVGYRTRYETLVSKKTRIEVITEGILIRRIQNDPGLEGVSLIIFDEFHERSIQADLGLALCLDLCELRDDLRLMVMSATLDTPEICALLGDAPHVAASGRSYPVQLHYTPGKHQRTNLPERMSTVIGRAWREQKGDILAFFPGVGEIHRCRTLLHTMLSGADILALYGNLSASQQDRVFEPSLNRRIILATPIAESSLTIDNIGVVVDSGLYRRPVHDTGSGLSRLQTMRISRASADQRSGRAGRTGPGCCYRLWSPEEDLGLLPRSTPEIVSGDLSSLVLELALWGITDPGQLRWLDPPRARTWESSQKLLHRLSLLDKHGQITQYGRKAASLPLHPRLATILLAAKRLGCPRTGCLLAGLLSEKDILRDSSCSADLETRLQLFVHTPGNRHMERMADQKQLARIGKLPQQWLPLIGEQGAGDFAPDRAGLLLTFGFPDRIGQLRKGTRYRYLLSSGKGAELMEADLMAGTELIAAPQVDDRRGDGKIFLAAPLTKQDLAEYREDLIEIRKSTCWNQKEKRVVSLTEHAIGHIVLESRPLAHVSTGDTLSAMLDGIRTNGAACLPFERETEELQARVTFLHTHMPERWPDWSTETLMADLSWLAPWCTDMTSLNHLKKLNLREILLSSLAWTKQQELDKLAPTHLKAPSGSKIRLAYSPGEPPVLAVRLQEMFGLMETPNICNGRVTVQLHLLSPARRPIQVTSDLASFWVNSYHQVRKEMAGRYPKHYWPEDPCNAVPTSGTKKQLTS